MAGARGGPRARSGLASGLVVGEEHPGEMAEIVAEIAKLARWILKVWKAPRFGRRVWMPAATGELRGGAPIAAWSIVLAWRVPFPANRCLQRRKAVRASAAAIPIFPRSALAALQNAVTDTPTS